MSLVVPLGVNSFSPDAGLAVIRRVSGTDDPESVNTYTYELCKRVDGVDVTFARGDVQHRYGDGAFSLLRKVLVMANV